MYPKKDRILTKVDLDALIPREDFEVLDAPDVDAGKSTQTIRLFDLKRGQTFLDIIRKPDFQRETNEWDAERISVLIESFIDGDLIPAIILWRNKGTYTFVVDGAHRLSALAAWINNDYGEGDISRAFYGHIDDEQRRSANKARAEVEKNVGQFSELIHIASNPNQAKSEQQKQRALNLAVAALQVQWVPGDARTAEKAYRRINRSAASINATELSLIDSRRKGYAISARAIIRSGTGHKYWEKFGEGPGAEIVKLAETINDRFFEPKFNNPIKTLDLPIGGKASMAGSLSMVVDFVNIVNGITPDMKPDDVDDDATGNDTINCLRNCKRIIEKINSNEPHSLGLHPAVYFYSRGGRRKVASLFAITALMLEFEKDKELPKQFTAVREKFEELLMNHDYLTQQVVRKYHSRSGINAYQHIKNLYLEFIKKLGEGKSVEAVVEEIIKDPNFRYLKRQTDADENEGEEGEAFSRETKSAAFIKAALERALKCPICGGLIHVNAINTDHKVRKEDHGTNAVTNAQPSHPYCNSTYKH